jgi:hypothetical protein
MARHAPPVAYLVLVRPLNAMPGSNSSPKNAREFLGGLPTDCIGSEKLLSRALYRLAYDQTQSECVGSVYQLSGRYGSEITLEHLLILPERANGWILGGFKQTLQEQADTPDDNLFQMCLYVGYDLKGGTGYRILAPKSWAVNFLNKAIQRRPLDPNDEPNAA